MELTITVTIDDGLVKGCADAAARALFKAPDGWRDQGAPGYRLIAQQVEAAVSEIDVADLARETARRLAKGIVEDVVREQLKRLAKETVKSAKEDGSLLL